MDNEVFSTIIFFTAVFSGSSAAVATWDNHTFIATAFVTVMTVLALMSFSIITYLRYFGIKSPEDPLPS